MGVKLEVLSSRDIGKYGAGPFVCTVDIGKQKCGLALWSPRKILVRAATVPSHLVDDWVRMLPPIFAGYVYENPRAGKVFISDRPEYESLVWVTNKLYPVVAIYRPQEWKGDAFKRGHYKQLERLLSREEFLTWDYLDSSARNAVGIGILHFGRAQKGGNLGGV